jgi:hypothetical protein
MSAARFGDYSSRQHSHRFIGGGMAIDGVRSIAKVSSREQMWPVQDADFIVLHPPGTP